jgi:hypothetical protein
MRKLIAVAAVLAFSSAHAAEELKFGDVNYFLKQGEKNVTADLSQTFYKQNAGGDKSVTRAYQLDTTLAYAFSDQLNAFVGLSYAYDRTTIDKTFGGPAGPQEDRFYSDGLANPALGVNYRLQNQNSSMYNVDLGAVACINIEDAETGSFDSNDGNFADPNHSIELNARMGRKWNEANEWQLAVGGIYNLDGESTEKTNAGSTDVDEDASYDLFLRATYQYRPVNEFMVLLSAQATQVGERDVKPEGAAKDTIDSHTNLDFKFTAKYLINDGFIGKFNWGVSRLAELESDSGDVDNRLQNFFGVGVDFLF